MFEVIGDVSYKKIMAENEMFLRPRYDFSDPGLTVSQPGALSYPSASDMIRPGYSPYAFAPLYGSDQTQEVPIETGFELSLRAFQSRHGKTMFPSDVERERMQARQPSGIDAVSYSDAFSYFAKDSISAVPGRLFKGLHRADEIDQAVKERLTELEDEQADIRRELESDKTLTLSRRNELISNLDFAVAEDREYLESQGGLYRGRGS